MSARVAVRAWRLGPPAGASSLQARRVETKTQDAEKAEHCIAGITANSSTPIRSMNMKKLKSISPLG